ncbi:UNVERIFIED_CONTAM: hypothetical protein Scaly_0706200 [Sesamum calycinum]|uniref:Uncharacterized protein n=1 Tax=Sesamum calycinum TaxID=2727403 RepID=A0AAW2R7I4_9LAMI
MPTFAPIAFQNLLEPDSLKKPSSRKGVPGTCIYRRFFNHKRRRGGIERKVGVPELPSGEDGGLTLEEEEVGENFVNEDLVGEEDEGFFDPRSEAVSVGSELEACDLSRNQIESQSFVSAQGEFFDAIDVKIVNSLMTQLALFTEFSSDGSISNTSLYDPNIESELHATRLSLLEEIERRKTAEETLIVMRSQWERIRSLMSEVGLTFPAPPAASDSMQLENSLIDQISQEVVVARFVAEAIGRGQARAEAEKAASAIIEAKDQEILRLRDRLQYYETVNHELSQRKLVEVARRQQERKRSRRRWMWSLMGLSLAVGTSLVAYSYIPHISGSSLQISENSADTSSLGSMEASQG